LTQDLLARAGVFSTARFDDFLGLHLRRILPTMGYARGQRNNHASSEAAALYVGSQALISKSLTSNHSRLAKRCGRAGRKALRTTVSKLVLNDGSFAQNSVNYHRLFVLTVAYAELTRQRYGDRSFGPEFRSRLISATQWLCEMTNPLTGEAPNLGANDGCNALPLHRASRSDFRPAIEFAFACLGVPSPIATKAGQEMKRFAGLVDHETVSPTRLQRSSLMFPEGGYCILHASEATATVRLPYYKFRPSHADALHLDLAVGGLSLFRDGGSFSYNGQLGKSELFASTSYHNTVEFDGRDQMPRVSRFLFARWLRDTSSRLSQSDDGSVTLTAQYRDYCGATHMRKVSLQGNGCQISDWIGGFEQYATLRYRLNRDISWLPDSDGSGVSSGAAHIRIESLNSFELKLEEGEESVEYGAKSIVPVLTIRVCKPGLVSTLVGW
jgi:Heparinase II/III-like protein